MNYIHIFEYKIPIWEKDSIAPEEIGPGLSTEK